MATARPMIDAENTVDCSNKPDGTFLPDPADCSRFFICDAGRPWMKQCPTPLYFDPMINVCNWPELVNCNVHNVTIRHL